MFLWWWIPILVNWRETPTNPELSLSSWHCLQSHLCVIAAHRKSHTEIKLREFKNNYTKVCSWWNTRLSISKIYKYIYQYFCAGTSEVNSKLEGVKVCLGWIVIFRPVEDSKAVVLDIFISRTPKLTCILQTPTWKYIPKIYQIIYQNVSKISDLQKLNMGCNGNEVWACRSAIFRQTIK